MTKEVVTPENVPNKFRPERPIFLNEENTTFKTKAEVQLAVEKLRALSWLCVYSETIRPIHMSFNDDKQFMEFKKSCKELDIKLKSPTIKEDDLSLSDDPIIKPEPKSTTQDPEGKVHILS